MSLSKSELVNVTSRFLVKLPPDIIQNPIRICFQLEAAHWFYLDCCRPRNKALPPISLHDFIVLVFQNFSYLQKGMDSIEKTILDWKKYKLKVPTYGAIMLDTKLEQVVLVKGFGTNRWTFPKGKINQGESETNCAVREAFEEVGYDISNLVNESQFIHMDSKGRIERLYLVYGIPTDSNLSPTLKGEIKEISWFNISVLPDGNKANGRNTCPDDHITRFSLITPYLQQIKAWIARKRGQVSDFTRVIVESTPEHAAEPHVSATTVESDSSAELEMQRRHVERVLQNTQNSTCPSVASFPHSTTEELGMGNSTPVALRKPLHAVLGVNSNSNNVVTSKPLGQVRPIDASRSRTRSACPASELSSDGDGGPSSASSSRRRTRTRGRLKDEPRRTTAALGPAASPESVGWKPTCLMKDQTVVTKSGLPGDGVSVRHALGQLSSLVKTISSNQAKSQTQSSLTVSSSLSNTTVPTMFTTVSSPVSLSSLMPKHVVNIANTVSKPQLLVLVTVDGSDISPPPIVPVTTSGLWGSNRENTRSSIPTSCHSEDSTKKSTPSGLHPESSKTSGIQTVRPNSGDTSVGSGEAREGMTSSSTPSYEPSPAVGSGPNQVDCLVNLAQPSESISGPGASPSSMWPTVGVESKDVSEWMTAEAMLALTASIESCSRRLSSILSSSTQMTQ